jgi:nascent polypeptide-associated complex subunit beta
MLPTIIQQLGADNMFNFQSLAKKLANTNFGDAAAAAAAAAADDDVPQLVENFDEASKDEKI